MDLKESAILGEGADRHWYYRAKAQALRLMLSGISPRRILDVGAGSGYFSKQLLRTTSAESALCIDPNYSDESEQFVGDKSVHFRRCIHEPNADLVLMMDVLEHVDDDAAFLREYINKVPAGTWFFISVPAFQFLWSGHDEFLEHKRRYTLQQVEAMVAKTGLMMTRSCYFFLLVFPIAATLRLWQRFIGAPRNKQSQLTQHHPVTNRLLRWLCWVELPLLRVNRLAGLSVFCLAQKP
jgi:hypothetical protein